MSTSTYLVFGDLHGRILPAFRLAAAWQREHDEGVAGILQVGDLGYFPDPGRLDKATKRHAERDPLELGARLVAVPSREADAVFADPGAPQSLWFTAGNHEDFDALEALAHGPGCTPGDFPVDAYGRVRCLRDGRVTTLPGGLRVGALWGIDDQAPNARRGTVPRGRIRPRAARDLGAAAMDVLLTHDSPRDAMMPDAGSEEIDSILRLSHPAFAFFGHYHGEGRSAECDFGSSQVYHLHGMEMQNRGGTVEDRSVGVLRWENDGGRFDYLTPSWLRTFTRHNWMHR